MTFKGQPYGISPSRSSKVSVKRASPARGHEGESDAAQSCPTLPDPMDCSPPGSSAHGVFQARGLESGAIAFSVRGPYLPVSKSRPICSHVFSEDSLALDSLGCILGIV